MKVERVINQIKQAIEDGIEEGYLPLGVRQWDEMQEYVELEEILENIDPDMLEEIKLEIEDYLKELA